MPDSSQQGGRQDDGEERSHAPFFSFFYSIFDRILKDRNVSPTIKSAIAIMTTVVLLLLLLVYVANGFIAPTYVRGQLYLYEKDDDDAVALTSINVWLNGTKTTPNDDGWFTIPVPNAGIPQKLRLEVENPAKPRQRLEYSWTGPIPLWNAFRPMEYVFEVRPYKKTGERLKRRESAALVGGNPLYAYAQTSKKAAPSRAPLPPMQNPKQPVAARWAAPAGTRRASDGAGEFTYEYGFAVNSFVVYSTRLFKSSSRVYFGMFDGEKQIDEWQLSIPAEQAFWEPLLSQGRGGVRGRFPARSNPEAWLQAVPGQTMRYAGIVCRLTEWANVKASPNVLLVEPRAPLDLAVWDDSGRMLGRFPVSNLLRLRFNGPAHSMEFLKGPNEGDAQQMVRAGLSSENAQVSISPVWVSRPLANRQ